MTQPSDRYRRYVINHWIKPARERGEQVVEVRLGDVRERMGLDSGKATDIGFALDTQTFERLANVELIHSDIRGPRSKTAPNNVYPFRIL